MLQERSSAVVERSSDFGLVTFGLNGRQYRYTVTIGDDLHVGKILPFPLKRDVPQPILSPFR